MKFTRTFKVSCSIFMSLLLSNLPATAATGSSMIPTEVVVEQLERSQNQKNVEEFLTREDVRKALLEKGLSSDEISARLASLSEAELRQLSGQIQEARAGGDILVAILVVVLIIYFIKRI